MREESLIPLVFLNIYITMVFNSKYVVLELLSHVVEIGLTMLFHMNLPTIYWVYAFLMVIYLINQLPSSILHNDIPYRQLYKRKPSYTGF